MVHKVFEAPEEKKRLPMVKRRLAIGYDALCKVRHVSKLPEAGMALLLLRSLLSYKAPGLALIVLMPTSTWSDV